MIELQLSKRRESTITFFEERESLPFRLVELGEVVRLGLRLPEERQSDCHDASDRQQRGENERQRQRVAGTLISRVRSTSLRCSRASGQSVINDPSRKTSPAIHTRLTSGFTKTRK